MAPQGSGWKVLFYPSTSRTSHFEWLEYVGITRFSNILQTNPQASWFLIFFQPFPWPQILVSNSSHTRHSSLPRLAEHHQQIPRGQQRAAVKTCQWAIIVGYSKDCHGIIMGIYCKHHWLYMSMDVNGWLMIMAMLIGYIHVYVNVYMYM